MRFHEGVVTNCTTPVRVSVAVQAIHYTTVIHEYTENDKEGEQYDVAISVRLECSGLPYQHTNISTGGFENPMLSTVTNCVLKQEGR